MFPYHFLLLVVKVIGKLQDGTLFLKKGHDSEGELFEFKTDEGNSKCLNVSLLHTRLFIMLTNVCNGLSRTSN